MLKNSGVALRFFYLNNSSYVKHTPTKTSSDMRADKLFEIRMIKDQAMPLELW